MPPYEDIEVRGFYDEYPDTAGLFSSIGKAFKSVGKAIGKPLAAVTKVVTTPITAPAKLLGKAVKNVPVLGTIVNATNQIALSPIAVTQAVLEGGRIDRVVLNNLKQQLASVKTLAPYIQTVISFVPGIGTGVSAAIGAGLALAEGKNITEAMMAGVKGAIPGGPAAQAAFGVATAAIQGKPIDQIALAALPIPEAQKKLLAQGLSAAKDIAKGKNVAHSIVDNAIKSLPPQYAKAVQIGLAMGQAKNLQEALKVGAKSAATNLLPKALPKSVTNIVSNVSKGLPMSPAAVAELAKHKISPATALALAKKTLPTKVIGVANPMRSPLFKRAGSIPIISLAKKVNKLSSVPSATNGVVRAIQRNPALLAQQTQAVANLMRTNSATVNDAMNIIAQKKNLLPWRSMSSTTVSFLRRHVPNAPMAALKHAHTNIGGLDSTGTTYIVEKGDSPWAIAQKLIGNGNRWKELLPYNKDKKPTLDKNVWIGEVINLPPAWQKPKATPANPTALPSIPVPSPSIAAKPDLITAATNAANSIIPGVLQAKTILVAWSKTDGINQAGVSDYGQQAQDLSTTMGPRDTLQLQSFQVWDNKTLGDGLNVSGNLDARTLQALQSWAANRASQGSVPSAVPIVVEPIPTVIPDIVIGGTSPTPPVVAPPPQTVLPAVASKNTPATGGSGALIAGGAVAGGLLFGIPGAIVGGIAGAALS
jgi:nucleoid-associated protein YgaU